MVKTWWGLAITLLVSTTSFADEINIPYGVYIDDCKACLRQAGFDFDGGRESDGFLTDRGTAFQAVTYTQFDDIRQIKLFDALKDCTFKTRR